MVRGDSRDLAPTRVLPHRLRPPAEGAVTPLPQRWKLRPGDQVSGLVRVTQLVGDRDGNP